ncbi:hypothetical protein FAGAP_1628 [Fusarium agapanthi]|uniref:Glucose-methanol-choline oxidoreductase N-terminal domain-containing protein n=1 Tax=Fusarium agapanthi TaxID=1803897 RepID=A0A9P5EHP9_9HYPO|nr:hypothetical protein FAGAP_1628 [Fusarium agapanthi]
MRFTITSVALLSQVSSILARYHPESTLSNTYDFIVVGGGTTGLILADRLSESGEQKVLVLEAGPDPNVVAMHRAPGAVEYIAGTAIDWNFYTEPQEGLDGRKLAYHRGRGLGGSSILNCLYYGRGSANVYDHWVELGNPGWGWEEVYPSFIKSTHFNAPNNGTGYNQKYQTWVPSAYSNGPLEIGYQGFVPPSSIAFIDACAAIDIPIVQDLNIGKNGGAAAKRPNVDILHNAPVQQIMFSKNATGFPIATGVNFIDHSQGRHRTVSASKEVIVTLGTFQSPQMLMVSGIGPEATLDAFNIEPVVINENVGQHMMDHNLYSISATVVPEGSTHQLMFNSTVVEASQEEYYTTGKGVYTAPGGITNGFQELSRGGKLLTMGYLNRILPVLLLSCTSVLAMLPASYNVVWDKPGVNGSADSMPLGGGDIGLNTWYENGTILMYVAKSGTFDENNSLLKLGRVRLSFDPNPFDSKLFEQRLILNDGYVKYTGEDNATAKIWVVFNPVVHVEVYSPEKIAVKVAYKNWRYEDRPIINEERNQGSWGIYTSKIANGTTYADKIGFHENGQGLEKHSDNMYNPMRDNEFGIFLHSEQLKPGAVTNGHYINTTYKAWNLNSKAPSKSVKVTLSMYQAQTKSHDEWYKGLQKMIKSTAKNTQDATLAWWHEYWARSYIIINEEKVEKDAGFQVGKNYQIWRYLMGCNAKGDWPTKFNGGLWTFDPIYVNIWRPYTPDYRRWGGGTFTAQNQRLLYWPLLRSGDFDVMTQQFDFYKRITPNAVLRGQVYQDIDAAYFLEQIDNTGLSNVFEYNAQWYDDDANTPRPGFFPDGELWNVWLNHVQDTANEFADMILQAKIYSGFDVKPYLEFIEYQLAWFDKFYTREMQKRNPWPLTGMAGNESLVIYPGSGAETYKESYNRVSTLAGLRQVVKDLLIVDEYALQNKTYYTKYLAKQSTPDLNHYGSAAIGLQEQLIQTFVKDDIRLLAAWPKTWDARFKVWAPHNTTVEGSVKTGKMEKLTVLPKSRKNDVIFGQD